LLGESLRLKRAIGDGRGEAVALAGLGEVELATRAYAEARKYLLDGLEMAYQTGDMKLLPEVLALFAELLVRQDRCDDAARLLRYTLQHQGASQEARQHAERLAEQLGYEDQSVSDGWQDERAVLDWLHSL
jgi:hypothetical protein